MYAKYGNIKIVRVWQDALWINNFIDYLTKCKKEIPSHVIQWLQDMSKLGI